LTAYRYDVCITSTCSLPYLTIFYVELASLEALYLFQNM